MAIVLGNLAYVKALLLLCTTKSVRADQRFVSSVGNIEKAMIWAVAKIFYQSEIVLRTDSNFPSKRQFFVSIFNKISKLEKALKPNK